MMVRNVWIVVKEETNKNWPKKVIGIAVVAFLITALFGLTFDNGPAENIPVDIVNMDPIGGSAASSMIRSMDGGETLSVQDIYVTSDNYGLEKALERLEDGTVRAVIVFGPNFTADIVTWVEHAQNGTTTLPSGLAIFLDGANPTTAAAVKGEAQRVLSSVLAAQYRTCLPVQIVANEVYGSGTDGRDFMAPAVAGLLIFLLTLLPAMMSSLKGGKKVRSEFSPSETVLGRSFAALLPGSVLIIIIFLTMGAFGIMFEGDVILTFLLFLCLVPASDGLGQFLSQFTDRSEAAPIVIPLILYPAILTSGLMIPVTSIPSYLLPISYAFPLTYAIQGGRQVMLGGFGLEHIGLSLIDLLIYAAAIISLACWLRSRSDKDAEMQQVQE